MNYPFGVRLWILITAMVLVAAGTIYGLSSASRQIQLLERRLTSSELESFRLAGEVQRDLANLNESVLRYVVFRDAQHWTSFEIASRRLDEWIDYYSPKTNSVSPLRSDLERHLFLQLNQAYDDYLATAAAVRSNTPPATGSPIQFSGISAFDVQAERMRGLARSLAEAHRKAESGFLDEATVSLSHLRDFLVSSVILLLILVGAMGWVIYRDLIAPLRTRLVRSQTLLEHQEKLATLGTLAAGIAHEIRNPLTSLKARLYTLEKHLVAVPAAKRDTDIIGSEISRLERIVQDVLRFARPSDPQFETLNAGTLLQEVHALMAPNLISRKVQLVVEPGPELLLRADSGHLKQVLINLVRNALEAIPEAGTVTLRARSERIRLGGIERDSVILEVVDTGGGIPPEVEKRLFDPFFSTKETGTGLGLPIAARIVERHGGALQYRTRVGHGTTFGVVLPREMPQTAVRASSA